MGARTEGYPAMTDEVKDLAYRLINIKPGEHIEFWRGTTFETKDAPIIEAATVAYELGAATIERVGNTFIAHGREKPYFPEDDVEPPLPRIQT
jgi:hypothetical protein